jgi:hypothetical protein
MNNKKYDVAAFIYPAYTGDELRSRIFWPDGIGEWETIIKTQPKFDGHQWPRKPLWGYQNEADPYVMEMQINAAADHGVNVFIYDWYWYDRRPYLENCLNDGYLKAKNNDRVKFYLMWCMHDVPYLWDIRNSHLEGADGDTILWRCAVDRKEFEIVANRMIEKYFNHPSYYRIDGKPVLMLYGFARLMNGLGGAAQTRDALDWFREQCVKAGLGGLHIQLDMLYDWTFDFSGVDAGGAVKSTDIEALIKETAPDSMTHYHFCHFADMKNDYLDILAHAKKEWKRLENTYDTPYFPHISLGWDNNPRFKDFKDTITTNNTPENVKKAFQAAKEYVDAHPNQPPLITINSWNEWTEASYLQPDDLYGYGYLEALKEVFM